MLHWWLSGKKLYSVFTILKWFDQALATFEHLFNGLIILVVSYKKVIRRYISKTMTGADNADYL